MPAGWSTTPRAALDDDNNGVLTGDELRGLAIWRDANGDGVCDPGEVRPLSDYGIVAVSCRFEHATHTTPTALQMVRSRPQGVTVRDGKTRPTFDLILKPRDGRRKGLSAERLAWNGGR